MAIVHTSGADDILSLTPQTGETLRASVTEERECDCQYLKEITILRELEVGRLTITHVCERKIKDSDFIRKVVLNMNRFCLIIPIS